MKSFLKKIFIDNWQRKIISLVLAMVIWIVVNHSLKITKTFHDIPVKVINIPQGKTIDGVQSNGILNQKITLTLTGNKSTLDNISETDLMVVVDASMKKGAWPINLSKTNLISPNHDINLSKGIKNVTHHEFVIRLSNLISDKIPITILKPLGEAPLGYQFLDIWPYQLFVTVSGPEETVKTLKLHGIKLRFNLGDITARELDSLSFSKKRGQKDEVSFFVPTSWKKVEVPEISESPLEIDDPQAKFLRIDFVQWNLLPLNATLPINVFYPLKYSSQLNPKNFSLLTDDFIKEKNGIYYVDKALFVRGVSRLFLEIVKDMIEIMVIAMPKEKKENLAWFVQFIYPHDLENLYVARTMAESEIEEVRDLRPYLREEYLRNRFRSYMNSFRLFTPTDKKLSLKIETENNKIKVAPNTQP